MEERALRRLAFLIGGGFHPDTRGEDYSSLPEGISSDLVDRVVDAAHAAGVDVYAISLDEIRRWEERRDSSHR